jgi:voltage-gated potassium channel
MTRQRLYQILDADDRGREAQIFRIAHHAMVVAGIAILLAATVASWREAYDDPLRAAVYLTCAFFAVEYIARLYAAASAPGAEHRGEFGARLAWASSLGGLCDLAGALPLAVLVVSDYASASLFSFVWALKLIRYTPALGSLRRVIAQSRQALLGVLLGFSIVLLVAASLEYLFERGADHGTGHEDDFASIPAALWWAIVTLTTTGYGDVVPVTVPGKMLAGMVMVSGILVFALWAGILASGYAEELRRREFLRTWDLVAKVPFFHDVGAAVIAEVARLLRPRDYPSGGVIFRRGEPGDCMYFIVSGEVEVRLQPESSFLGPGHFFGEIALLTGAPRGATIISSSQCTLLTLDIVDFRELLGRQPELARVIHAEANARLEASAAAELALAMDESAGD